MHILGVSRFEASWYIPVTTLDRMQKAYLELQGEGQKWGKSRLDKITEILNNAEQS